MSDTFALCVGGVEIVDACRSLKYRSIQGYEAIEQAGVPVPPAWFILEPGACACCDCTHVEGDWAGDPDELAPWVDLTRPESLELWAITPRVFERTSGFVGSDGGDDFTVSDGRCEKGVWRVTLDLFGTTAGLRHGVTWLRSVLAGCDHSTCFSPSCNLSDMSVRVDCETEGVIRDARVVVFRVLNDESTGCSTRVELVFESSDQRVFLPVTWVEEFSPASWPAATCNHAHPIFGQTCECDTVIPELCEEAPLVEWPADTQTVGCAVTAGEGEDSPLTQVVQLPSGVAKFSLTSITGLAAPVTSTIIVPPTSGVVHAGGGTIVWDGFTTAGAGRCVIAATDTTGATCQIALGVVILPCCDEPRTIEYDPEPEIPEVPQPADAEPPPSGVVYVKSVWRKDLDPNNDGCIEPGQVCPQWDNFFLGMPGAPAAVTGATISIPKPQGVSTWSWTAVTYGGATISGPTSGTTTGDITIGLVDIPVPVPGVFQGVGVIVTPTHDGSTLGMGGITATISGGNVTGSYSDTAPGPPLCACLPQPCGCATPPDEWPHSTVTTTGDNVAVWSPGQNIASTTSPAFGAVEVRGPEIVWTATNDQAWSDVIEITLDNGCTTVLAHHHTQQITAATIECTDRIAPPTPQPDTCQYGEEWCEPAVASVLCATIPADIVGAEPVVEVWAGAEPVKLKLEWHTTCGGCDRNNCGTSDTFIHTYRNDVGTHLEPSGGWELTTGGTCQIIDPGLPATVGRCGDLCVCFILPPDQPTPTLVRVGYRRWTV